MAGETKFLEFAEGVVVAAPDQLFIKTGKISKFALDADYVTAKGSAAESGDFYYNTTINRIKYYNTAWRTIGEKIQEVPTGLINSSNTGYTLSQTPVSDASVCVYLNGLFLTQGVDYTISGTSITMTEAPTTSSTIAVMYQY